MIIQQNLKQLFNKAVEIAKAKYSKDFYFKIKEFKNISITSEGLIEINFITLDDDDEMEDRIITLQPEELKDSDVYLPLYVDRVNERNTFKLIYDRYIENRSKIINQFIKKEFDDLNSSVYYIRIFTLLNYVSNNLLDKYNSTSDLQFDLGIYIESLEDEILRLDYESNDVNRITTLKNLLKEKEIEYKKLEEQTNEIEVEQMLFIENLLNIIRNNDNSYVIDFLEKELNNK